jgi:hypothetical protein
LNPSLKSYCKLLKASLLASLADWSGNPAPVCLLYCLCHIVSPLSFTDAVYPSMYPYLLPPPPPPPPHRAESTIMCRH